MKYLKLLLFLSISGITVAQSTLISPNQSATPGNFTGCITDAMHQQQMQSSSDYNQRMQIMNHAIANFDHSTRGGVLTIPIVIHIIHNNGPENISDAQVLEGIQHLNLAFANAGSYSDPGGVNTNIQFCLAKQDPQGNFTTGINRVVSTLTDMNAETQDLELKELIRWDPTKYLNIWLVKEITSFSMGSGMAGYAYYPAAHGTPIDGIVNEASLFGSNPNNSKVHIHEAGHYLGLYHTFEGGCTNNNCQTDGDMVCDTPPDNSSAPDIFCGNNNPHNTCNTDEDDLSINNPFRPIANGGLGDQVDPIKNYMDYGLQSCQKWFSQGQGDRMYAALTTTRSSLLQTLVCLNPCTSSINTLFTASATTIHPNDPITFTVQNPSTATYTWTVNGVQVGTGNPFVYNNFSAIGEYVIGLTGDNGDPSCKNSSYQTITVKCPAEAAFNMSPNSPYPVGTNISAFNFSVNANTLAWYLDGVYVNGNQSFNQQFNTPGAHSLFLVATYGACADTSEAIYFTIGNCNISGINNHWVFNGHTMNFSNGEPTATFSSPIVDQSQEITTSICNPDGDLLFFSDGLTVWDKNHNIMPNGANLLGHASTTQSCLATPFPGNPNLYYLFTLDAYENAFDNGLRYSIIDMTLNNGLGDVIPNSKNVMVRTDVGEMLSATFHANGHDIWIATNKENGNTYYTHLLTAQGISTMPVVSVLGTYMNDMGIGCMKFSSSGNKWAATTHNYPRSILVADFNRATGAFYNAYNIPVLNGQPHSLEFSPDNSKLYVQSWSSTELWQFNLAAGGLNDVINSKYVVNPSPAGYGVLCRGNNGKIYTAATNSGKIDYIANPNVAGAGCNYTVGTISAISGGIYSNTLPNMIQGLGEAYIPSISGKLNICPGETVNYNVPYLTSDQSVIWTYIGSGSFASNGSTATLSNLSGQGLIKIKVTGNCGISYDSIQVNLVQPTQVHLPNDTALCEDMYLVALPQGAFTNYVWNTGSISTSIMAPSPGTYWVETTDANGCKDRDTITISGSAINNPVYLGEDTVICSTNITLDAGSGYLSYNWQNGSTNQTFTVTQPGIYWVSVSDGCGSDTDSLIITPGSVNFNLTYNGASVVCKSSLPFTLQAPAGYASYLWNNGSTASSIYINTLGTYYVTITDANGCSGMDTLYVVSCAGIDGNITTPIHIYPNPANQYFTVELNNDDVAFIYVYDAAGKLVFDGRVTNKSIIHTENFATGVYTTEIRSENSTLRQKLIVIH